MYHKACTEPQCLYKGDLYLFTIYLVVVWLICSCKSPKGNSWQWSMLSYLNIMQTNRLVHHWQENCRILNDCKIIQHFCFLTQKLDQGIHIHRNRQLIPKKLRTADIDIVLLIVEFTLCCFVNGNLDIVLKPLFRLLHASWNSWLTTLE